MHVKFLLSVKHHLLLPRLRTYQRMFFIAIYIILGQFHIAHCEKRVAKLLLLTMPGLFRTYLHCKKKNVGFLASAIP